MLTGVKKSSAKFIALLLAAVMILSLVPLGMITDVLAASDDYKVVEIDGTKIYFYGVTSAGPAVPSDDSPGCYDVPYTGGTEYISNAIYLNGEVATGLTGSNLRYQSYSIEFNAAWIEAQTGWIAVKVDPSSVIPTAEPEAGITGINIVAYNQGYDGGTHDAVAVNGTISGDEVWYSVGGGAYTQTVPTLTTPSSMSVIVKVVRDGFTDFVSNVYTATVSNGTLTSSDITVTPYANKAYDGNAHDAVTVTGAVSGDTVEYSADGGTYSDTMPTITTPGSMSVTVKVIREHYNEYISAAVEASIGKATIDGITVAAYIGTYDAASHDAVTVTGDKPGDTVLYSTDGVSYTETVPTITNAGKLEVYVKVEREHYEDYLTFPTSFEASVAKATIEGVTATGYRAQYDKSIAAQPAITSVAGELLGDTITYSTQENSVYSSTIPTVRRVNDSGTYYVKIHRDDNYEDLIIPVTVSITKNPLQEIRFGTTSDVTYKETNTFQYEIAEWFDGTSWSDNTLRDEGGTISYSIVNAGTTGATINASNGTVTYNAVGTVVVKAEISGDNNFSGAETTYTIAIKYVDTPIYTVTPENHSDASYNWHNGSVTIAATGWEVIKSSNVLGQNTWATNVQESTEATYDSYKVAFKNAAGEITDLVSIDPFALDLTAPEIDQVTLSVKNSSIPAKVLNILSFGLFFNEEVEVTVEVSDEPTATSAGLKAIKLFQYDADGAKIGEVTSDSVNLTTGVAKFTIEVGFEGTLKVEVVDNVDNTRGERLVSTDISNIGNTNGYMMLETDAPTLSDIIDTPMAEVRKDTVSQDAAAYSGDAEFKFTAQDKLGSGLYEVSVKINDVDYANAATDNGASFNTGFPVSFDTQDRTDHTYIINTTGLTADADGKFVAVVKVTDNAGNVTTKTTTIYKDETSPTIKGFEFSLADNIDVNEVDGLYEAVEVTDYGFYFKQDVLVTITAEDLKADNELNSGVRFITYKAIDIDGTTKVSKVDEPVDENGQVSFTISENFKGQIYAYAIDWVGNTPNNSNLPVDYDATLVIADGVNKGFVNPNGSVVENVGMHADTSSIKFTPSTEVGEQNNTFAYSYTGLAQADKDMDYNASNKVPLYKANPTFGVEVEDTYSGIRSVKWTIIEATKANVVGEVSVDNMGALSGDTTGWTATGETGSNLITKLTNSITIDGNANDMVLLVELTDRAGNISYDYYAFGIDKTNPNIDISYNNNAADSGKYFKADRTATIVVTERNFNADDIEVTITNTDGVIPTLSSWNEAKGTGNQDNTTYTATITYHADGDYTFGIEYTDLATNKCPGAVYAAGTVVPTEFAIDQTMPVISVSYDNNAAVNDKYFAENRTATITVIEHNFDVSRVQFTQTATLDGTAITVPSASWSNNGDTHTATISYAADGDYTFDVTMADMAGNESAATNYGSSVAAKDFVVDTYINTEDKMISGVENGVPYKDDVIPAISFNDVNYDRYEIELLRTRKDQINVDVTSEFIKGITEGAQSITGSFDTFNKIQENDGIYTLTLKVFDKASNEHSETVTFSVNRFGSVYVLNDYLISLRDGYIQEVDGQLMITEYNPDRLVAGSLEIEITRDGAPLSDVAYDVAPVINDMVAVGNSGWYQYEYTIDESNFNQDGIYQIVVSSKDAAGNTPETTNYDDTTVLFRVDTTKPEITNIVGLENAIVNAENQEVTFNVFDAIGLKKITVYVNDAAVKTFDAFDDLINFSGTFTLEEGSNQKVRFEIEDLAGNVLNTDEKNEEGKFIFAPEFDFQRDLTVSTNFFVRWYANKPLFWCSIGGVAAIGIGLFLLLFFKKRKKDEEEPAKA